MSSSSGRSYELRDVDVEKQPNPAVKGVGDIPSEERPDYVYSTTDSNALISLLEDLLLTTHFFQATVLYLARPSTMARDSLRKHSDLLER